MNVLEFENHLKASNRQEGYLEIIMYVPDSNIGIANVSSTDKLYICDILTVQELLGHESLTATSIYTHVTNDRLKEVYYKCHPRAKK